MGYKASFSAVEIFKGGAWVLLGDPNSHSSELHPLSVDPISEQVARINLPEARTPKTELP
jgi:arginine-tRNA-protein transferase